LRRCLPRPSFPGENLLLRLRSSSGRVRRIEQSTNQIDNLAATHRESQSGASPSQTCKFHRISHSDAPYKNC